MRISANDWLIVNIGHGIFRLARVVNVNSKTCEYYDKGSTKRFIYDVECDVFANLNSHFDYTAHIDMWLEPFITSIPIPKLGTMHLFRTMHELEMPTLTKVFDIVVKILEKNNIDLGVLTFELRSTTKSFSAKKPRTVGRTIVLRGEFLKFDFALTSIVYHIAKLVWLNVISEEEKTKWTIVYHKQMSNITLTESSVNVLVNEVKDCSSLEEFFSQPKYLDVRSTFKLIHGEFKKMLGCSEHTTWTLLKTKPKYVRKRILSKDIVVSSVKPVYRKRTLHSPADMFATYLTQYWISNGTNPMIDKYFYQSYTMGNYIKSNTSRHKGTTKGKEFVLRT